MKKVFMMLILMFFLLATVGTVFGQEIAKEGSNTGKNYLAGSTKVLAMGENNYKATPIQSTYATKIYSRILRK